MIKFFTSSAPGESKTMQNYETKIFIYNLKEEEKRRRGFETLKEEQDQGNIKIIYQKY